MRKKVKDEALLFETLCFINQSNCDAFSSLNGFVNNEIIRIYFSNFDDKSKKTLLKIMYFCDVKYKMYDKKIHVLKIIFENILRVVCKNDVNLFLFSDSKSECDLNAFLSIFKINFVENQFISFESFENFVKFFLFSLSEKERRFVVFSIDSICKNINKK